MLRVLQMNCQKASKSIISPKFVRALSTTKYSKSHEYVKIDGDIGTVGITDFAAAALGDIVFVDMPSVGTKFESGDTFGSVESVKAASDVYSPVSGTVIEVNSLLEDTPGTVNESPLDLGWFMKLKLGPVVESEGLMDIAAYTKKCEEEAH
mmetsp:Transcript_36207/g.34244  ORF Transcript_36207/g.34244 Transcript_36207/m.34244 type:complete len:151 (-) Transcript_36207:356-808(-)|eukprot:CAMPEP_0119034242 /NCGR_PEP_ID=MMETSP1177-20130426/1250_1 /TAXON_ID=2985 /ORGANISM="Ochromonas sp, Strain CCMP1899" /LENGTH=150 /DNA_ID=CAMNT_0006991545 /DNA_START=52 /DNA_END=504 /DNA_ORIENTATION=+